MYPDTKPGSETMYQIFNNDKMGMVPTGPWQLPDFVENKTDYGVVPLPTFNGEHVTIAGPDTWTVFDNGSARVEAAVKFLTFLTDGAQDVQWASQAGSLPLRSSTAQSPEWKKHVSETVGLDVFSNALDVRAHAPDDPHLPEDLAAPGSGDRVDAAGQGDPAGRAGRGRAARPTPPSRRAEQRMATSSWRFAVDRPAPARGAAPCCSGGSARPRTPGGSSLPAVVIILGLSIVPMIWSLLLSMQSADLVDARASGSACTNYRVLSQDPNFRARRASTR